MTGCATTQENQQYLNCIHSMNYAEVINVSNVSDVRYTYEYYYVGGYGVYKPAITARTHSFISTATDQLVSV